MSPTSNTTGQDPAEQLLALLLAVGEGNVEAVNSGAAVTVTEPGLESPLGTAFSTTVLTLNHATPAITIPAPQVKGSRKRLYLVQDATGSRIPSWATPAGCTLTWFAGEAPVLSTAAAAVDYAEFESLDGTNWVGKFSAGQSEGVQPAVSSPTLVSGTALQDTTGVWSTWYIPITGHAAGTVVLAVGPTSGVADQLTATDDATLNRTLVVRVPPLWYVKVTVGGSAAIGTVTQITG